MKVLFPNPTSKEISESTTKTNHMFASAGGKSKSFKRTEETAADKKIGQKCDVMSRSIFNCYISGMLCSAAAFKTSVAKTARNNSSTKEKSREGGRVEEKVGERRKKVGKKKQEPRKIFGKKIHNVGK